MRARYKSFQSRFASREKIFDKAVDFLTEIGPARVITLTYSEYRDDGVVTVWYWEEDVAKTMKNPALTRLAEDVTKTRDPAEDMAKTMKNPALARPGEDATKTRDPAEDMAKTVNNPALIPPGEDATKTRDPAEDMAKTVKNPGEAGK